MAGKGTVGAGGCGLVRCVKPVLLAGRSPQASTLVNAPHHLNPNAGEIETGKDMPRGEKEVVAAQDPLVASHKLSTELQQAIGLAVIHAAACCSFPGDEPQPVSAPLTFRGACWARKCCVCFI
jgi:hypothetical protein